jgi:hypothetical protein
MQKTIGGELVAVDILGPACPIVIKDQKILRSFKKKGEG